MTQKQKNLLLKDLCGRLNTNLVCSIYRVDDYGVGYRDEILHGYCKGDIWYEFYFDEDCGICIDNVSKIKPYLFPLSSITEEQEDEWYESFIDPLSKRIGRHTRQEDLQLQADAQAFGIEYLLKNHFDIYGLIPMGLALNATGLNIY